MRKPLSHSRSWQYVLIVISKVNMLQNTSVLEFYYSIMILLSDWWYWVFGWVILMFISFFEKMYLVSVIPTYISKIWDDKNTTLWKKPIFKNEQQGYFHGLVHERCNSIANALELCLSCTNPSICSHIHILWWISLVRRCYLKNLVSYRVPFCRQYFQMHFHEWKFLYFDYNFTEICCYRPNWQ